MGLIAQINHWLAPWQSIYNNSKAVSSSVTAAHVLAMLFSGGFAIAADRSTLRAWGARGGVRQYQLTELGAVHRPVVLALGVVFLTGLLLTAADFKTFIEAPIFWLKLGLVALLLLNGGVLTRTEAALRASATAETDDRLWARLRVNSWLSIGLWTITLVVGVFLTDVA